MRTEKSIIKLRKLKLADARVFTTLANNKNIWLTMRDVFPHPYSKDDAISFINFSAKSETSYIFAITFNDEIVGAIGLHRLTDLNRFTVELGYWIGEPYWNKGIASKAVQLVIDFGFKTLDINRIYASTIESNLASSRVLEKNNFIFEGVSKKSAFKNNKFLDEYRFALLKNE
jgi:RimJ/RimL family protein N-acetyltransferase